MARLLYQNRNQSNLSGCVACTKFSTKLREEPAVHRGFSAISTAKAALSSLVILPGSVKLGDHPLVKQYMRGLFNEEPPRHWYAQMWDPADVLDKLQEPWVPAENSDLKYLSMKVVMLILLTTGRRGQIITALNLDDMAYSGESFQSKSHRSILTLDWICMKNDGTSKSINIIMRGAEMS